MVEIRALTANDWPAVEAIYADGIATGDATFEPATPTWEEFDTGRLLDHRFVAVEAGEVIGWVALSPTSSRACYAGVVEHSALHERAGFRVVGRRERIAQHDGVWRDTLLLERRLSRVQ